MAQAKHDNNHVPTILGVSSTDSTTPVPITESFRTPLAGTAATAWNFDPGAATTTVYCTVSGFKSKV